MLTLHHINCGRLIVPGFPTVVCHGLAVCESNRTVLIDPGIGLHDIRDPVGRLGRDLIDAGFQFNPPDTAVARLDERGIPHATVGDIVLTHADPDHAGGLADFPDAAVHISQVEHQALSSGHPRYRPRQFDHGPRWRTYGGAPDLGDWFGLPAWRLHVPLSATMLLVPLPGHTRGHCGVAIETPAPGRWLLHVGDAYYLRGELTDPVHPVSALAASRADDDAQRQTSLAHLRRLACDHVAQISMVGYHDLTELPPGGLDWARGRG